jgi:hypothetical protein
MLAHVRRRRFEGLLAVVAAALIVAGRLPSSSASAAARSTLEGVEDSLPLRMHQT